MIEFIRGRLNSFLVLLLLGVLVASFAFFGIGDVVQVGQGDSVARVGDRRITIVELARAFENFVDRQRRENPEVTPAVAIRQNVDTRILQQLVQQAVVIQSATNMDISASPDQTRRMIAALPIFQINGRFDVETYKAALTSIGVTEDQLFKDMERDQIIAQMEGILAQSAHVPKAMADAQIAVLLETRQADALLVPVDAFASDVSEPSDKELETFFNTVRGRYSAPEYRSFRVVYLTTDAVADDITVAEADIRQAYALRKEEFGQSAKLDLQLVTFDTLDEATAFKTKAINGALYIELAEAKGSTREDIDLGSLARAEIENLYTAEIADALFALGSNDISEPLEGPFGYQVFRVVSKTAEDFASYDDVKEDIRKDLAKELAIDRLSDIGNAFQDEFAAGATLEEAAKVFGIPVTGYSSVSDTGVDMDGTLAANQANLQTILPDVFQLDIDNELEVNRLGDDGYYIVALDDITPTRPKELSEVTDDVITLWKANETDRLALLAADALAERVRQGETLQVIAAEKGYELLDGVEFNRIQAQQGSLVNADLAPLLFSMRVDEVDVGRSGDGTSYVVAKLLSVEEGDSAVNETLAGQLQKQLQSFIARELQQQFIAGQAAMIDTTFNQRALETLRKRYDPTL